MNWNPFESSLFTGAGTPWGAMETGRPGDAPQMAQVNMDPGAYKGFDRSGLKQAMMQSLAKRGMRSKGQALAGLQKAGIRGADTSRALVDIEGQQGEQANALEAQMALADWQDRVAERDKALALAQSQAQMDYNRWLAQNQMYQQEQAQRGGFWNSLLGSAGSYLGAKLGSK